MRTLLGLALLTLLAGCKVAAHADSHAWTVKAPSKVDLDSKLHFTVETRNGDLAVVDVPYLWKVEWVGLEGIRHQGRSFREESIRVKGEPGIARVRIFAFGDGDHLLEVASAEVRVVSGTPPAD